MASIQILLLAGPQQGQRLELSGQAFLFGRQTDCDIPISGDFVSREHGMIALVDDQWMLQNASPNGTKVNNKKVGRKGFKLLSQDIVQVGGQDMFQVIIPEVQDAAAPVEEISPVDMAQKKAARKNKIWISIGVYLVVMMGLLIYGGTLKQSADERIVKPPELTRTQIETVIRKPVKVTAPDPLAAAEFLNQADELYNRQDASYAGTYRVYHAYKMALAHSQKNYFDNKHQLRFDQIQNQLIVEVWTRYNEAFERLRSREYKSAEQRFRRLNDFYPDTSTLLFKNCEAQRRYILKMRKKYKR